MFECTIGTALFFPYKLLYCLLFSPKGGSVFLPHPLIHPSIHLSIQPPTHPSIYRTTRPVQRSFWVHFVCQALFKDEPDTIRPSLTSSPTTLSFTLVSVTAAFLGSLTEPSWLLLVGSVYWDSLWLNTRSCVAHSFILFTLWLRCPQQYFRLPLQLFLLCFSWTTNLWWLEIVVFIYLSSTSIPKIQAPWEQFSLSLVLHP